MKKLKKLKQFAVKHTSGSIVIGRSQYTMEDAILESMATAVEKMHLMNGPCVVEIDDAQIVIDRMQM